jgi:hypothetical protein
MTKVAAHVEGLSSLAMKMHEHLQELIEHSGEQGRSSEHVVRAILRSVLPKRFSIGTGVVVSSHGRRSKQTDIVIYDDFYNAAPSLIGDVGIFPIECVYAAIEVKSTLDTEKIKLSAEAIGALRVMKDEKYYRVPVTKINTETGAIETKYEIIQSKVAPRTYLFAFDADYVNIATMINALSEASSTFGAFFHGVIILSKGWFVKQRAYLDPPKFKISEHDGARHFSREMLSGVNDFEMYPAAMEKYLGIGESLRKWEE